MLDGSRTAPRTEGSSNGAPDPKAPDDSRRKRILMRVLGGSIGLTILLAILLIDRRCERPWIALVASTALGLLGAHEFVRMLRSCGVMVRGGLIQIATATILLGKIACHLRGIELRAFESMALLAFVLASWMREVLAGEAERGVQRVAYGALVVTYGLLYSFLIDVLLEPRAPLGVELALWLVLVSKSNDIGGFLIGNWLGGRKLAPKVSPGKTWSGSCGGIALSLGVTFLGAAVLGLASSPFALIGFAISVSIATQFGDLAESLLKRACSCKDSGRILPTFGGALDVIDSLAFAAPVGYVLLNAMEIL